MFDLHDIISNPVLGAGAIMGIVYSLKEYPKKLFDFTKKKVESRFIYTVRIPEYDDLFDIFEKWLYLNHPTQYRDVQANISFRCNQESNDQVKKRMPSIFYRQAPTLFTLRRGGKTIFINKQEEKIEHAQSLSAMYGYKYAIKGYRCREEINRLLEEVINDHYSALGKNTIRIRSNDEWGGWLSGHDLTVKGLDQIVIPSHQKSELKNDIDQFIKSKQWYNERGIPYKRTFCLHGRPGTGKTSLALAIAAYTDRDIYTLNLSSLRNDSAMQAAIASIGHNAVVVLEDIDAAFIGREAKNNNISFACLLNCTDGALYREGVIIIITTNHLDKLDPALLREGRTDKVIKIDYPQVQEIEDYLSMFYGQPISLDCDCDCDNMLLPMSAVQEACIANKDNRWGAVSRINSLLLKRETV